MDNIINFIINFLKEAMYIAPVLLISLTIHELAHGFVAYKLGDNTAKNAGRLTLNPLKHLDPIGTIMFFVAKIGWAKPVPVDMRNFKKPKEHMVLVGIAGPVSNILIAFVFSIPMWIFAQLQFMGDLGQVGNIFLTFFTYMYYVNLSLAVFNLIPIPPLDGSKIFFGILPDKFYYKMLMYERQIGMAFLLLLIVSNGLIGNVISTLSSPIDYVFSAFGHWILTLFF